MPNRLMLAVAGAGAALPLSLAAVAQTAGKPASAGAFSKAQADHGAEVFQAQCAKCHGASMEGLDVAPPLTGPRFMGNWLGQPIGALAVRIRTSMPLDMPGALGLGDSAALAAAILAANGYPAGPADMPTSPSQLQAYPIDAPPGGK